MHRALTVALHYPASSGSAYAAQKHSHHLSQGLSILIGQRLGAVTSSVISEHYGYHSDKESRRHGAEGPDNDLGPITCRSVLRCPTEMRFSHDR